MKAVQSLSHPFEPVWSADSRVLVLGTFPSAASRAEGFYYAHPRNRFWPVMAAVHGVTIPLSAAEKTAFLLHSGVALWDVLSSCEISGSGDASIRSAVPNDIPRLIGGGKIRKILLNGRKAYALYQKYCAGAISLPAHYVSSTSPANASVSLAELIEAWRSAFLTE